MLDIEARVLIGWYSLASQSERMPTRCFYVKVAYLSYGEYINYRVANGMNEVKFFFKPGIFIYNNSHAPYSNVKSYSVSVSLPTLTHE